ncbi:PIN domain-containing protein [Cellulophaga lytica]|nr:PIN domain-containing protein [Cellulophaga lytica]
MINIIVIDTNILRGLGPNFFEKIDYISLQDYCYSSASEIIIPNTVIAEYLNYYEKEIIQKSLYEIDQGYSKLLKLNKFKTIDKPDLKEIGKKQLVFIENKLTENRIKPFLNPNISENELVKFLIENKQEIKKDNTRDFIIWTNTLEIAEKYKTEHVVLISNDKIFKKNESFERIRREKKIKNLSIFDSIANFLSVYGFKSENLTKQLIIKSIPISTIQKELKKDKNSIPSHISQFYYHIKRNFKLEKFEIQNMEIEEFYSHKDTKTNEIKVIVHVNVKVLMIFEPEKDLEKLNEYLNSLGTETRKDFYPNSFDKDGRPIFDDWILFHFGLVFNESQTKIEQIEFYDFFPDEANFRRMKAAHNKVLW